MSALDLPPGIGLVGTPLGTFGAPRRARRAAAIALTAVVALGAITWLLVSRHPFRRGASTQVVMPIAFAAFAGLGFVVRRARVAITRDGVRWGWAMLGFHQPASRIATAHVYRDGIALEARRGSWWFIAARDWERFDVLVRHLRRADLPIRDHPVKAPLRARLQSYGRFLDLLLLGSVAGAVAMMLWAM
ncbi:MAG: hypothetical protein E6J90_03375 [Deltaproteobacteria bacterium]|nr:MAG: hypothetical protein E6J91_06255 [Deltaproteobacteria bacterium]TMQ27023.1 MAG: hypothetical protein E6J90_03375 [Deltaproteobacteria bacterium]